MKTLIHFPAILLVFFLSVTDLYSQKNHYINTKYDFSLFSDPSENNYIYSFFVYPVDFNAQGMPDTNQIIDSTGIYGILTMKDTVINGIKMYFIESETDGAAGSWYQDYIYATQNNKGQGFILVFNLRFSNCDNYDNPKPCKKRNKIIAKTPNKIMKSFELTD